MSNHNTKAPRRMTFAEFVTSRHDITGEWPYYDRHGVLTRTRVSDPPSPAHTPTGSDIIAGYCAAIERRRQIDTAIEAMEQFIAERCGFVADTPDGVESDSTTEDN